MCVIFSCSFVLGESEGNALGGGAGGAAAAREKGIKSDVGDERRARVRVLPHGAQRRDGRQRARREAQRRIGIRFHVGRRARPGPGGLPRDDVVGEPRDGRALRPARRVRLAPEVVVDDVAARRDGAPLVARLGRAFL